MCVLSLLIPSSLTQLLKINNYFIFKTKDYTSSLLSLLSEQRVTRAKFPVNSMKIKINQAIALLFFLSICIVNTLSQIDPLFLFIGENGLPNDLIMKSAQTFIDSFLKKEYSNIWHSLNNLRNDTTDQFNKTLCYNQFLHMIERVQKEELWAIRGECIDRFLSHK